MTGFFPVCFTLIFGTLAFHNVRTMNYRTVPLVRRELDKQLTTMVLTQDIVTFFTVLPFSIMNVLSLNTSLTNDPTLATKVRFATSISVFFYYSYFASPFFVYIFASERFRRQLIYVLFRIHLERWQRAVKPANQIELQMAKSSIEHE
ncbi:hypothetical protein I4U23_020421 [Adineta vaga]|nr:hypothetical protein I4U23_020421 [Adineta vaga]